ncbi:glycine betaine ABC transporter substrate-binding protein [Natrarchaeobius sp. A-rgal3]|uniref:ABC transporter substrate-binding protein n=1 Tax=Natrarchaeobius versutus TaxID=1679078 RepID=UPI00350F8BC8
MGIRRRDVLRGGGAALPAVACGCLDGGSASERHSVSVGSKGFVENEILGELIVATVEATGGEPSRDRWQSTDTRGVLEPLFDGEIDAYWEYTGTLYAYQVAPDLPGDVHSKIADAASKSRTELSEAVAAALEESSVAALTPAEVDNTYRFVARREWAEEAGVRSLSELATHINDEASLRFSSTREFTMRSDAMANVVERYGIEADATREVETVPVDAFAERYDPIERGDVDVCIGYATDPQPEMFDLVTLADDLDIFPAYTPVPLVRRDTLEKIPPLESSLDALGETLESTAELRELVRRVVEDGSSPERVAADHLEAVGH